MKIQLTQKKREKGKVETEKWTFKQYQNKLIFISKIQYSLLKLSILVFLVASSTRAKLGFGRGGGVFRPYNVYTYTVVKSGHTFNKGGGWLEDAPPRVRPWSDVIREHAT